MTALARNMSAALALAAALVVTAAPTPVAAQEICLIRDDAIAELGKRHGERLAARGLADGGRAMLELLKNETGSWTLVATDVHGRSCILATGEAWNEIETPDGAPS